MMARIRQSLFDIVRTKVPGSYFLDLFSGTGSVGLEALSRGAQKVLFLDLSPQCLKVIEKNVDRAGFREKSLLVRGDARSSLKWLLHRTERVPFDLIFLGPPYWEASKYPHLRQNRKEVNPSEARPSPNSVSSRAAIPWSHSPGVTPGSHRPAPLKVVGEILQQIVLGEILAPEGWVVAQHHRKEVPLVPESLEMFRQTKYGDNMLSFFKYKDKRA